MEAAKTISIPVKLDEKTFRRFARFDMLILRKKWVRPAVFSAILIAFAIIALLTRKEQSGMIAAVLLVYTLTLGEAGIHIENNQKKEASQDLSWSSACQAFRKKNCIYLYVTPQKAFLLPGGQASVPDEELWDFVKKHLGAEKCR